MDGAALAFLMVSAVSGVVLISSHQICYIESEFDSARNNRHRWILPSKDPCGCNAIHLGGMTTSSNRQGAPYLDNFFLSEDPIEIRAFFNCEGEDCFDPQPLGLEDGTIPDLRIRVSSTLSVEGSGRLNGQVWVPKYISPTWFEVDLGVSTVVSGVITQGGRRYRVTKYEVRYKKLPSSDFKDITSRDGSVKVFDGNIEDASTPVINMFDQSILANVVRIVTVAFNYGIALRLELLGCHTENE